MVNVTIFGFSRFVVRPVRYAFRPDIVVERYHNFGGEAVRAALRLGVPVALEVNAPIVDHPGSAKQLIDRALLVQPMRRWRDWQCAHTDLFITPSRATLPAMRLAFDGPCWRAAGDGFNVLAYDRICGE